MGSVVRSEYRGGNARDAARTSSPDNIDTIGDATAIRRMNGSYYMVKKLAQTLRFIKSHAAKVSVSPMDNRVRTWYETGRAK